MSVLSEMTEGLDSLTKGVNTRKAKATGPRLTPVGTEANPTKPSILPNDTGVFMSNEALREASVELRANAHLLNQVADGIDKLVGTEDPAFADVPEQKKVGKVEARLAGTEPEVDPGNFAKDFDAKKKAAQAATFTAADADTPLPIERTAVAIGDDGWVCPTHGAKSIKQLTSRKGRTYRSCTVKGCTLFEKE